MGARSIQLFMRFTLTYDGPLPSRGNARDKNQIREAMAPQLKELWTLEPLVNFPQYLRDPEPDDLSVLTRVGGQTFAPLVCHALHLRAELDLLMLRPERPGAIITSGRDIDNRLKTLFDALRVPGVPQELVQHAEPSTMESPLFTLLEDAALITRVSVDTDRLLAAAHSDHVRLVMRVRVVASRIIYGNQLLTA